ncbi:ribokinase [Pseudopedobacter beijingensis]|uniref:Ribokinase n=1 Tax=Pseudopedobacter beijingensis TaxID=1207056 RepID=A0ABW4IC26_9SPHI
MSQSRIIVIGSSNTDMVVRTEHFPQPGETVLGNEFLMNPGGKGANQAVAAARLGGNVVFICKIGDDLFGESSIKLLKEEGININHVLIDNQLPSGVALITIDKKGENNIVVAPGANAALSVENIKDLDTLISTDTLLLMQLEIPLNTVKQVVLDAYEKGAKIVLNPAPACELPEEIYQKLHLITPNEKEASMLTGIQVKDINSAKEAAEILIAKGVKNVVITLGAKGALAIFNGECLFTEAKVVNAIDTTAAGDVFNGALVVALNEGKHIKEALEFAVEASAISVTRLGAQSSAPYRNELESYQQKPLNQL